MIYFNNLFVNCYCYCVVVTVLISQHKLVVDRECQSPIDTNASKSCPIPSVPFIDCDINAKQTKTNCFTFLFELLKHSIPEGRKKSINFFCLLLIYSHYRNFSVIGHFSTNQTQHKLRSLCNYLLHWLHAEHRSHWQSER